LINLGGKLKLFSRIVHCQVGQLREGDEVKLHVFPVDPVPIQVGRETVLKDRVYYAFEPAKP
ncbi:MAG: hypothetical protein GTO13_09305, partial [Proteobacteria bacterium]|nr:hypothetical protein [Pseudomonadota bacterium]